MGEKVDDTTLLSFANLFFSGRAKATSYCWSVDGVLAASVKSLCKIWVASSCQGARQEMAQIALCEALFSVLFFFIGKTVRTREMGTNTGLNENLQSSVRAECELIWEGGSSVSDGARGHKKGDKKGSGMLAIVFGRGTNLDIVA